MKTIELDSFFPRPDRVAELAKAIQSGQLVAMPTDTTWAIVCDPFDRRAVQKLQGLRLKMTTDERQRKARQNKPLSILASKLAQVGSYVLMDSAQFRTARALLPGPYTLLLPASREVPRLLRSKRTHVGVRVPDNAICSAVAEHVGNPLMTTTVRDDDGGLVGSSPEVIRLYMNDVDLIIETEPILPRESTVLDLTVGNPLVIRAGAGAIDPSWDLHEQE